MGDVPSNIVVDLSTIYGPSLIATFLSTAFYGMTCMQMLMYFTTYESDSWYFKGLIIALGLLDTAHEILCIKAMWNCLIPVFGDLKSLQSVPAEFAYQGTVTSFVAFLAQSFYTWRIWRFSKNNWLFPLFLIPLNIAQLVAFIIYTVKAGIDPSISHLASPLMVNLVFGVFLSGTIVDMAIAITMCALLYKHRTGFFSSYRTILRLMNASVTTGTCTAIFSLWASVSLRVWPNDLFYPLGILPLCPLYCNAVLANLNSRNYIRETQDSPQKYSTRPPTSIQLGPLTSYGSRSANTNSGFQAGRTVELDAEEKFAAYHNAKMSVRVETSTSII